MRLALARATVSFAAISYLAAPLSAAASSPSSILEWGKPVATGGPGDTPTVVQMPTGVVAIDAGNFGDVLVLNDGTVWAWGVSSMTLTEVPGVRNVIQRPVDGNGNFTAIEQPGRDATCPTSTTVVRWSTTSAPRVVTALNCLDVVQLASAAAHTFALTASGEVYVWGGAGDVLGLGSGVTSESTPTLNPALTALTGGTSQGVVITTGMTSGGMLVDGKAWSWGDNQFGQCGCRSSASQISTPTPVDQGTALYTWIDQGGNLTSDGHELAIDTNGNVWAWGDNAEGQLGIGTSPKVKYSDTPVAVVGLPAHIVDARAGGEHSLALDSAGNVWAWGDNQYGQVGNGTTKTASLPAKALSGATMISAGSYHSIAASPG